MKFRLDAQPFSEIIGFINADDLESEGLQLAYADINLVVSKLGLNEVLNVKGLTQFCQKHRLPEGLVIHQIAEYATRLLVSQIIASHLTAVQE